MSVTYKMNNITTLHMAQQFTVYPKKYAHGFCWLCFVVVIHWLIFPYPSGLLHWHCGNRILPSASKATLMNMGKYFMWMHYERLHNHNKTKHNKTVCIFLWIYCSCRNSCVLSTIRADWKSSPNIQGLGRHACLPKSNEYVLHYDNNALNSYFIVYNNV